ncbi:MAG: 5-formyltetrahydrofolate cyclo-ligase [Oscillospiraceae bacterium]|nr:5-formyltetrahydrofolate cyclo-ligase [Oscillospiraceae bacterium]
MQEIITQKKDLRQKYLKIRKNIPDTLRSEKNFEIFKKLLSVSAYNNCSSLLTYVSYKDEAETEKIILSALDAGKTVAVPLSDPVSCKMTFYKISSLGDLKPGYMGIPEPDAGICEPFLPDKSSVCITPGVVFDKNGFRIGYGKGFYDRFLENFCGISIGLTFSECLCDVIPNNNYDRSVDIVVTDKSIFTPSIKRKGVF